MYTAIRSEREEDEEEHYSRRGRCPLHRSSQDEVNEMGHARQCQGAPRTFRDFSQPPAMYTAIRSESEEDEEEHYSRRGRCPLHTSSQDEVNEIGAWPPMSGCPSNIPPRPPTTSRRRYLARADEDSVRGSDDVLTSKRVVVRSTSFLCPSESLLSPDQLRPLQGYLDSCILLRSPLTLAIMGRAIPVIDVSNFEQRRDEITSQILAAASDVGFLQIVNHGIPQERINAMFAMSQSFFALDDAIKSKYPLDKAENKGWEKLAQVRPSTGVADPKESIQLGFTRMEGKWPTDADCPGFKAQAEEFMHDCHSLSMRLLSCFADGLGFRRDFFTQHHDTTKLDCQQALRLLHYLDCTGKTFPAGSMRAGAHTDFDTLTLLFQRPGQGGLEVCPGREAVTTFASGDEWTPLEPCEGAICINIGDMLMQWSDDRFKSTFHRVRTPRPDEYTGPRYSIAFFNQVNKSSVIAGPQGKYAPVTGGEFMAAALKRNYDALEALRLYKESGLAESAQQIPAPAQPVLAS